MSLQDGTTNWSHDLLAGLPTLAVGADGSQLASSSSNLLALPTLRPQSLATLTPLNSTTIRSGRHQGQQRHPQTSPELPSLSYWSGFSVGSTQMAEILQICQD